MLPTDLQPYADLDTALPICLYLLVSAGRHFWGRSVPAGPDQSGGVSPHGKALQAVQAAGDRLVVFISYSRRDATDFALELATALEAFGHSAILDLQDISGGQDWRSRLRDLITEAHTVVFVMTPGSAASEVCAWEVEEAYRLGKRLVPVIAMPLGSVEPPERLRKLNYIYFFPTPAVPESGFGYGIAKLDAALKTDVSWLREHRNLLLRSEAWQERGRDPGRLLSASLLAEVDAWLASRPTTAPDITPGQRAYLDASRLALDAASAARKRELDEREELVREAEAAQKSEAEAVAARKEEQAKREAAQQEALRQQERATANALAAQRQAEVSARRLGYGLGVAAAALVIIAGLAVWALDQREKARAASELATQRAKETDVERSRAQLTGSGLLANAASQIADNALGRDATTAVLLALEGLPDARSPDPQRQRRKYAPEVKYQLTRALGLMKERLVLFGHTAPVLSADWHPKTDYIVSGSGDGTARIWHAADGRLVASLAHPGEVTAVAWSPDGSLLLTGCAEDSSIRVWHQISSADGVQSGWVERFKRDRLNGKVQSVAWRIDGARFATGHDNGITRVWDGGSGQQVLELPGHGGEVYGIAWHPDGSRLATASFDKTARVVDAERGSELAQLPGHGDAVRSVSWSPDGRMVLTTSDDAITRIFDPATGNRIRQFEGHEDAVASASWSPDGGRIATAAWDGRAQIHDAASTKVLARLEGHTRDINQVRWSGDGRSVVTVSDDGTVRIWRMELDQAKPGKELSRFSGHTGPVKSAAFSPDGTRVLSSSKDQTARVIDTETGRELLKLQGHTRDLNAAVWSRDAKLIMTVSDDAKTRIHDATTGALVAAIDGDGDYVNGAAWSPDGRRIVTASSDGIARVFEDTREVMRIKAHSRAIWSAAWSPDGRRLLTASDDGTARVWDATSGGELLRLEGHLGVVQHADWSPDGTMIATASYDNTAAIWSAIDGHLITRLQGHTRDVNSVAWSPDGKRVVTSSDDRTARVFQVADGVDAVWGEIARVEGHDGPVADAAWNSHGSRIVTASRDGTVRVWLAGGPNEAASRPPGGWDTDALVESAKAAVPRCLTREQRQAYFLPPAPPDWCIERKLWPYHTDQWQAWGIARRTNRDQPLPAARPTRK